MTQRQRQLIILIFAALLLIVGLVLVIVVLMNPDFLSRPTVSRFIIDQPRRLDAHVEHTSVSGHLECSGKTSLSEMQIIVYVRGIKPVQEEKWRRNKVPCVTEVSKEWTLSSDCTTFPKKYSDFSLIAILVRKDEAAYLPWELVAKDGDELTSKLRKYAYPCDNYTPCNSISPVIQVNRTSPVAVEPTVTPVPTSTRTPTNTPTPSNTPSTPTLTPTVTETPTATGMPTKTPTITLMPTPTATSTPITTQTPTPSATDTPTLTYTPTVIPTPTVTPTPTPTLLPAPILLEPKDTDDAVFKECESLPTNEERNDCVIRAQAEDKAVAAYCMGDPLILKWDWYRELSPGQHFAVRVWEIGEIKESIEYIDNKFYELKISSDCPKVPFALYTWYNWNVAVVSGGGENRQRVSEDSEARLFYVKKCWK